jgi:hypothetical protein
MRIKEGQKAKDFTVEDIYGNKISLKDYKEKNFCYHSLDMHLALCVIYELTN